MNLSRTTKTAWGNTTRTVSRQTRGRRTRTAVGWRLNRGAGDASNSLKWLKGQLLRLLGRENPRLEGKIVRTTRQRQDQGQEREGSGVRGFTTIYQKIPTAS